MQIIRKQKKEKERTNHKEGSLWGMRPPIVEQWGRGVDLGIINARNVIEKVGCYYSVYYKEKYKNP